MTPHPVNPTCRVFLRGLIAEHGPKDVRDAMKRRGFGKLTDIETRKQWGVLHEVARELDNPAPTETPRNPEDVKLIETLRATIVNCHNTTDRLLNELAKAESVNHALRHAAESRSWLGRLFS